MADGAGFTNLVGGFLQGFAQARAARQRQDTIDEFKRLQTKKFKADLDAKESQLKFANQFASYLTPGNAPVAEGPPQAPQPAMTVSQALADPQGQIAALRSGLFTPKDIGLAEERQRMQAFRESLNKPSGGGELGYTPESLQVFAQTNDPKDLKAIEPKQVTVDTPEGPRIKSVNPYTGDEIADLGPAKAEKLTPEQAGRITGLEVGREKMAGFIKGLVNPDGSINRRNVATMSTDLPFMGRGIPFTTGRKLRSEFSTIADSIIRARTGAGMNEKEAEEFIQENLPSAFDNDDTVKSKIERLQAFLNGALDAVTLPPRLRKLYEAKRAKKAGTQQTGATAPSYAEKIPLPEGIPAGSRLIGTSQGKPVYQAPNGDQLIVK